MTTVIATVLIFLLMISLHEFGHFISGKLLGFNVLEYAVGFGPAIFKKQGKKTLYSVRIIPFGGFCKFAGEDGENEQGEGDFNRQPGWRRIIVLAAGAVFNIILGFFLFMIVTLTIGSIRTNEIKDIVPGSYLEENGVMPGDEIIEINGHNVDFYNDIDLATGGITEDSVIDIKVKRDGEKLDFKIPLSEERTKVSYFEDFARQETFVNGKLSDTLDASYSEKFPKDEKKVGTQTEDIRYILGLIVNVEKVNITNILPNSYYMTKYIVKLVCNAVSDLITGNVGIEQLSGPVGIVTVVNDAVKTREYAILNLLNLTALLTINLGIFNLLPLPALDGGRIIFVLIEMIRRKPIPPEKEGLVHSIGFILLILLMVFVAYQDVLKLF